MRERKVCDHPRIGMNFARGNILADGTDQCIVGILRISEIPSVLIDREGEARTVLERIEADLRHAFGDLNVREARGAEEGISSNTPDTAVVRDHRGATARLKLARLPIDETVPRAEVALVLGRYRDAREIRTIRHDVAVYAPDPVVERDFRERRTAKEGFVKNPQNTFGDRHLGDLRTIREAFSVDVRNVHSLVDRGDDDLGRKSLLVTRNIVGAAVPQSESEAHRLFG